MNIRAFTWYFAVFIIIISLGTGCRQGSKTDSNAKIDSLIVQYQSIKDSIDVKWNAMIADDDEKHQFMKRLLLEVSYTNNYDKGRFDELNKTIDTLRAMRYDQQSMSVSESIDTYDSATFAVSNLVIEYAMNHPRFQDFPLMEELINDINHKNDQILFFRIHYDQWAKELNAFIENKGKKLMKARPEIKLEKMPLFELPA